MSFARSGRWKTLIRRATLLGLVALVIAGLMAYRDRTSPRRAWLRAIEGPDREARSAAWTRLQRDREIRGLGPAETAREVLRALDAADPETRAMAASTLGSVPVEPVGAIARLTALLDDPNVEVRTRAVAAVGDLVRRQGPGRDEALRAIERALKDAEAGVRLAALSSLGQLIFESSRSVDPLRVGRADDPALALAVNRLQDPDLAVWVEAAYVLACNDRGAEAVPRLVALLEKQPMDEPPTRAVDRAFLAVMVLAVRSDAATTYLGKAMGEPREGHPDRPRDALAWVARQSGEARARVKRVSMTLLGPDNPSLRHNAGLLLHEIGSDQPARAILIEALKDESVDLRLRAIDALFEIAEGDAEILEALRVAAEDPSPLVRERAAAAVERIEWEELIPELNPKTN